MSTKTLTHRLARPLVRPLVGTPITANHLTTLRLITGIGAAICFAIGTSSANNWGGGLFVFSAFLDRADGELARIKGACSDTGHVYDVISDAAVNALLFVGIGFGARESILGLWAIPAGIVAGGCVAFLTWIVFKIQKTDDDAFTPAWGFDPDDALFLVGPIAWLGGLTPFLVAAVIGAPTFTVWVLWRYRHLSV